jgi:predicted nucleic acid-binding protein
MFTTNRIFIDSSVLVEYIKGTKLTLLNRIMSHENNSCFVNETVVSEYLLYFLAINGNSSPKSLKKSGKIADIFNQHFNHRFLLAFSFLASDENLFSLTPRLMAAYNLLPNDAIILATCKIHSITKLASHDTDFIIPCKAEGIELLRED